MGRVSLCYSIVRGNHLPPPEEMLKYKHTKVWQLQCSLQYVDNFMRRAGYELDHVEHVFAVYVWKKSFSHDAHVTRNREEYNSYAEGSSTSADEEAPAEGGRGRGAGVLPKSSRKIGGGATTTSEEYYNYEIALNLLQVVLAKGTQNINFL